MVDVSLLALRARDVLKCRAGGLLCGGTAARQRSRGVSRSAGRGPREGGGAEAYACRCGGSSCTALLEDRQQRGIPAQTSMASLKGQEVALLLGAGDVQHALGVGASCRWGTRGRGREAPDGPLRSHRAESCGHVEQPGEAEMQLKQRASSSRRMSYKMQRYIWS